MNPQPTPYTFGAMSLGQDLDNLAADVALVRHAMDAAVWFHASPTYRNGFSFAVLRMAFDQARHQVPRMIIKIRDGSAELMRFETEDVCRRLGLDGIDVAQLVSMHREGDNLLSQLQHGGPLADELASLRERGLIRHATLFVDRQNAEAGLQALASPLVDGLTGYWNACQRELTPSVWRAVQEQSIPYFALRTLAGAGESDPGLDDLIDRAGCADAVEFAFRLAASYPCVHTTIGGTRRLDHLERFLEASEAAKPLSTSFLQDLDAYVASRG